MQNRGQLFDSQERQMSSVEAFEESLLSAQKSQYATVYQYESKQCSVHRISADASPQLHSLSIPASGKQSRLHLKGTTSKEVTTIRKLRRKPRVKISTVTSSIESLPKDVMIQMREVMEQQQHGEIDDQHRHFFTKQPVKLRPKNKAHSTSNLQELSCIDLKPDDNMQQLEVGQEQRNKKQLMRQTQQHFLTRCNDGDEKQDFSFSTPKVQTDVVNKPTNQATNRQKQKRQTQMSRNIQTNASRGRNSQLCLLRENIVFTQCMKKAIQSVAQLTTTSNTSSKCAKTNQSNKIKMQGSKQHEMTFGENATVKQHQQTTVRSGGGSTTGKPPMHIGVVQPPQQQLASILIDHMQQPQQPDQPTTSSTSTQQQQAQMQQQQQQQHQKMITLGKGPPSQSSLIGVGESNLTIHAQTGSSSRTSKQRPSQMLPQPPTTISPKPQLVISGQKQVMITSTSQDKLRSEQRSACNHQKKISIAVAPSAEQHHKQLKNTKNSTMAMSMSNEKIAAARATPPLYPTNTNSTDTKDLVVFMNSSANLTRKEMLQERNMLLSQMQQSDQQSLSEHHQQPLQQQQMMQQRSSAETFQLQNPRLHLQKAITETLQQNHQHNSNFLNSSGSKINQNTNSLTLTTANAPVPHSLSNSAAPAESKLLMTSQHKSLLHQASSASPQPAQQDQQAHPPSTQIKLVKPSQRVQSRSNRKKVINSNNKAGAGTAAGGSTTQASMASNSCNGVGGLAISSQRYSTIPTPVNAVGTSKNTVTSKNSVNVSSNRSRIGQPAPSGAKIQQNSNATPRNETGLMIGKSSGLQGQSIQGCGGLSSSSRLSTQKVHSTMGPMSGAGSQSYGPPAIKATSSAQNNHSISASVAKEKTYQRSHQLQIKSACETTEEVKVRSFRPLTASGRHQRKATQGVGTSFQSQTDGIQSDGQQTPSGLLMVHGTASQQSQRGAPEYSQSNSCNLQQPRSAQMTPQMIYLEQQSPSSAARLIQVLEAPNGNIMTMQDYQQKIQQSTLTSVEANQLLQYQTTALQQQQQQQLIGVVNCNNSVDHQITNINNTSTSHNNITSQANHHQMIISNQQIHQVQQQNNQQQQQQRLQTTATASSNQTLPSVGSRTGVEIQSHQTTSQPQMFYSQGGQASQASTEQQQDYFVLDNENRVILVSHNGTLHPNTAVLVQQQQHLLNNGGNHSAPRGSGAHHNNHHHHHHVMHKASKSSNTRMSENSGGRPMSHVQHKIMEQFVASGKGQQQIVIQSQKQKQTNTKVAQALKENNFSFSHHNQLQNQDGSTAFVAGNSNTRNDQIQNMVSQKATGVIRNSNQNMKTAATRLGNHHGSTYSASSQNGVSSQAPPPGIVPTKGVIYQLEHQQQYFTAAQHQQQIQMQILAAQQQVQANGAANANGGIAAGSQKISTTMKIGSGVGSQSSTRPRPRSSAPTASNSIYSTASAATANINNVNIVAAGSGALVGNNIINQTTNTTTSQNTTANMMKTSGNGNHNLLQQQQQQQQQQLQCLQQQTRKQQYVAAATTNLGQSRDSRIIIGSGATAMQQQAELIGPPRVVSKSKPQHHDSQSFNENHLMQTTGHIIVTTASGGNALNGAPLNELQMPMIINQTHLNQQNNQLQQVQGAPNNTLCITGLMHPDMFVPQHQYTASVVNGGTATQTIVLHQPPETISMASQAANANGGAPGITTATVSSTQATANGGSQPSSKRRDGNSHSNTNSSNLQPHASSTQNGFFGKRKNRDRDNKTTMNSTSVGGPGSNFSQQQKQQKGAAANAGNQVIVAGGNANCNGAVQREYHHQQHQSMVVAQQVAASAATGIMNSSSANNGNNGASNYQTQASHHQMIGKSPSSTRPLTGKVSTSFHKTQASISMKVSSTATEHHQQQTLAYHHNHQLMQQQQAQQQLTINQIMTGSAGGDSDSESISRHVMIHQPHDSTSSHPQQPLVAGAMVMTNLSINKRGSVHKQQSNTQLGIDTCGLMNSTQSANSSAANCGPNTNNASGNTQHQKNLSSVRSGQLINVTNSISSADQQQHHQILLQHQNYHHLHQQHPVNSNESSLNAKPFIVDQQPPQRSRALNQSASPSTKISIRGRKGVSSIMGSGSTTGNNAGSMGPGLQMLPSTPKTFKRTKRVLFARRMNLMDRPMLIITFQGVLGDFMKKPVPGLKEHHIVPTAPPPQVEEKKKKKVHKEPEEEVVNLRAGAIDGLRYLSQLFQLIIFSRETVEDSWFESQGGQIATADVQTKAILNFLQQNPDIKLDGFYASAVNAKSQTMTDDYSQIFIDFGLNSEQKVKEKVLFVSSITSDFICNQRLPACGNISPKGKKPNAAQLGISYARGLTDIDNQGFFMFDTSCQPPLPLVKGLPISLEMKQHQQAATSSNRGGGAPGTRSNSIMAAAGTDTTAASKENSAATNKNGGEQQLTSDQQLLGAPCASSTSNFSSQAAATPDDVTTRQMPSTLLVPNLRTQNAKTQTNFSHILKSIMMLAFLGQKKTNVKSMILKEASIISDYTNQLLEIESEFGAIKEKQLKLTQKKIVITPQLIRGQTELIGPMGPVIATQQHNMSANQKHNLQRRTRQIGGNSNSNVGGGSSTTNQAASQGVAASMVVTQPRETESPASDLSGRNGSRGRVLKQASGKQLHLKVHTTTSSRTAATTHLGNENTNSSSHSGGQQPHHLNQPGVHQHRSSSINSDKGGLLQQQNNSSQDAHQLSQTAYTNNGQLPQNDSSSNIQLNHAGTFDGSPQLTIEAEKSREVIVDITDPAFFANLSWAEGVDYINHRKQPLNNTNCQRKKNSKFLGMQGACSDVVWRYYRKQALERIKLRQIYETKMQATEQLVKKTLSNETIVANQQKSIDQIFEILRSRDLVGNPFGFTMGRNYRFFANLKVQVRRKLARELEQWKARNEAAAASQKPKETTATPANAESAAKEMSAADKELAEASRFNLIIQSQQMLQQQQHEALEELLEKNKLINRVVVVGLDAPALK